MIGPSIVCGKNCPSRRNFSRRVSELLIYPTFMIVKTLFRLTEGLHGFSYVV
ncbi:hypothetical protein BDV06DRAFT_204025 [Aspergillus oleicola]